jgi:hypothetical protein
MGNMLLLADALPNVPVLYEVPYDGWTHLDMVMSMAAAEVLYEPMIEMMDTFGKN